MTSLQPEPPVFNADPLLPSASPLDYETAGEKLRLSWNIDPFRHLDPDLKGEAKVLGPTLTSLSNWFAGKAGARGAFLISGMQEEQSYSVPLNFEPKPTAPDQIDPASYTPLEEMLGDWRHSGKNNLEGITELVSKVNSSEWPWVLEAKSYGELVDRVEFLRFTSPEFAQQGNMAGDVLGFTSSAAGIIASSLILEPLPFILTGTRATMTATGTQIGVRAAVPYFGRSVDIAHEAAMAARNLSTVGLMGRYAALGVAEETVLKVARSGIDPTYRPDMPEILTDTIFSAGIAGALGGWAGRQYVNDLIESTANRYLHEARIRDTTISISTTMPFATFVAADRMLISPTARNVDELVEEVATNSWQAYSTTGREFVPGTQSVALPVLSPATARRRPAGAADATAVPPAGAAARAPTPAARRAEIRRMAISGIQSNILSVVAEIQRRGGEPTEEMVRAVTDIVFNAFNQGLRGQALESHIWARAVEGLPARVAENVRLAVGRGNAPSLRKAAADFDALTMRNEVLDGLWMTIEGGADAAQAMRRAAGTDNSLILQVAFEIQRRGGEVTRESLEGIVDDIRELIRNPPRRTNARGRQMLDARSRRAQLAEIINRRVPVPNQRIYVPRYLNTPLNTAAANAARTMNQAARGANRPGGAGVGLRGSGAGGTGATPSGSAEGVLAMQNEVPQLTGVDTLGPLQHLFNQAANVLRHNNPIVRLFGYTGLNARRAMNTPSGTNVAQGQTVMELGTMQMVEMMARTLLTYRNAYTRYALNIAPNDRIGLRDGLRAAFGNGRRATKARFDAELSRQLRSGAYNSQSEVVNQAARELRNVLNDMHGIAHGANVRGFRQGAQLNYLSRLYRWSRIERLSTTAEGRQALRNLMAQALQDNAGLRRVMLEDGTMATLADVDQAATVLSERLIALATRSENAPLTDIDQELADALEALEAGLAPAATSRTPFGRARIIMNEEARVATTGDLLGLGRNELTLADLTADDVPLIMKRYMTSVMGAVNERRMLDELHAQMGHYGILGPNGEALAEFENFEQFFDLSQRLGRLSGGGGAVDDTTLASMREIVAALRYEPLHRSNAELGSLSRVADRVTSIMLPMGYMTTGGGFGLAALTETSRLTGTFGLRSTVRQMPIIREMINNWRNMDEGVENTAAFLDQAFSPSTERLRRALFYDIENQLRGEDPSAFMRGMNSVSNFFSDISMLSPITSFTQHLSAAVVLQHLYDTGIGVARRLDDATIRTLGLEPDQYDELMDWVRTNAVLNDRGRVVNLNNLNALEFDNLRVMVDRTVRTRIQDIPTRGDMGRWAFSWYGRLLTQFRTFNLKGIDNFLLQNVSRARRGGGVGVSREIFSTMLFAGLIQYSRKYMEYESKKRTGDWEGAKEIEDNFLGVDGFVRGAFTGPSEFFLPILAADATWTTFVSDDPLFSAYRYSGLNWYGFPAQSFVSKGIDIGTDIYGATVARGVGIEDKDREITRSTIHKMRLLMPGQNLLGLKDLLDIGEAEIGDAFNLSKQQPRKN